MGEILKLDSVVNIQGFLYKDQFTIIEINPRIAGSAIFSIHGGFDPYLYIILKSQGKSNEWKYNFKKTKVIRFWDEIAIQWII